MSPSPSPSPPAARRRSRRRRWIALATLLGLALAAWFLRASLLERVAAHLARTRAGLDVRFEGLAVEGLSRIRAERVLVAARDDAEALRSARIEDLEVEVDVRGLWSDRVVVRSLRVRTAAVEVDARRAGGGAAEGSAQPFRFPDTWPAVEIGTLDLDLDAAAGSARLRGASLALGSRPGAASLAVAAPSLELADGIHRGAGPLELRVAIGADGAAEGSARFGDVLDLRRARYAPDEDGGFEARLEATTTAGSAELEARADRRAIRVRGALERVELAEILRLLGADAAEYGGTWSARGSCVLPRDDPASWTADADVQAVAPRIAGRDADWIAGRFLATAESLEARGVLLLAGANAAVADLVRVPRGADLGCEFLARATITLDSDLRDVQPLLGEAWRIPADAPPHRVRLRAALADGWIHVDEGRAEIGRSLLELGPTRVPVAGGADLLVLDPATAIELALHSPESADLARLLLPAETADALRLRGAVDASVRLSAGARGVSARIALSASQAAIRGIPIDALSARAGIEAGRLDVERLELDAGRTTLEARGAVDLAQQAFEGLEISAESPDLAELARALGAHDGTVAGRGRLAARLDGPLAAPTGTLEAELQDGGIDGLDVAWARLRARGTEGAIVVEEITASLPLAGTFTAAGRVASAGGGRFDVDVARLDVTGSTGAAVLAAPARAAVGPDAFLVEELSLAGGEGALRVSGLRVGRGDGSLCGDVAIDDAHVGRILRAFGAGLPAGLRLDGRAALSLAGLGTEAVDGHLDVALDVSVPDLRDVPLPGGFTAAGSASARVVLAGAWREPRGTFSVEARDLDVLDAAGRRRVSGAQLTASARLSDGVDVETCALRFAPDALVEAAGRIDWPLDLAALAAGAPGAVADARLDLTLRAEVPDLAPLADAFEVLRRTAGSLTADLALRGTAAAPRLDGRLLLRQGALKLSTALPAISDVEIDVALSPERVAIERATGRYGGGQVDAAGSIALGGPEPVFDLALHAASIPLLRSAQASMRSDLDVRLTGPWRALVLSGTAALLDARFAQRLDLERLRAMFESRPGGSEGVVLEVPAITEPPFDAMRLELDVRSDTPVRVRTPLLRAEVLTRFAIRGTGALPLLSGSLEITGGRIALPASKLDLAAGRVDFDPNDPGRARLDVTAEGRVSGYDVRARVTGTTDEPVVEITSIPPETQEDLALLLLAGRPPGSRGLSVETERVAGEVASYVARDIAFLWFGDAADSFTDRLEMSTGADVSQSGADTIEVRFRLAGPARGAGRAVYLRGERDVYDRVNMGVRFVLRLP